VPTGNGHELLKRRKSNPRTSRIVVIVLTSSSEERDVMRTYEVGADSDIVKPVDLEQFTESVRGIGKYRLVINSEPRSAKARARLPRMLRTVAATRPSGRPRPRFLFPATAKPL
jgi:DNA-binding response OmpR family regulator